MYRMDLARRAIWQGTWLECAATLAKIRGAQTTREHAKGVSCRCPLSCPNAKLMGIYPASDS
jgi:hypothetical protein